MSGTNDTNQTVFQAKLDGGTPMLSIGIHPCLVGLDSTGKTETERDSLCEWTCLSALVVSTVLFIVFAIEGAFNSGTADPGSWKDVVCVTVFLSAIVILCWIGCRHSILMEKIVSEERKHRFDMRKVLIEKSMEYAEKQTKPDGKESEIEKSKWSISITVNKNAENGKNDNPSDDPKEPKPDNDNPPPKPAGGPSPDILPSNSGTSEPAVNRTDAVPDETIGTHLMCNGGVFDSGYAEPTTSAGKG